MEAGLLKKNGFTIKNLAKLFITYEIDSRIPTISELEKLIPVARGTIQNSLKFIENEGAIAIRSRGQLGSFLIDKDIDKLLAFADIRYIMGAMPLPYSKRYEGLATGIIKSLEKSFSIPVNMAYMNGAKKRIEMVLNNRYDFTVVSKYAALEAIQNGDNIRIVNELGKHTYLSAHVLVFHDELRNKVDDDMLIGIDKDSIDQENLTRLVCGDKKVEYIKLSYNQIIEKLLNKEIDAAVWNADELRIKSEKLHSIEVHLKNGDDTEATIVIAKDREELAYVLQEYLNVEEVVMIQKEVVKNNLIPRF